jgi:two-component system nitrogen regulation response regulator NtrX
VETAVQAVKRGADDFLETPLSLERVLLTLERALERSRLARERDVLAREVARQRERLEEEETLLGEGTVMTRLREEIRRAGASDARVLITGESGVGKEVVARTLHRASPRAAGPFVEVNGAAIPEDLIESELFGHVKGSFTGATEDRKGKWELADGGTLFLDEIGDMSPRTQAKILRAIQDGKISRVGGAKTIATDVRIVAATNRDLPKMIAAGTFREDLYFRLAVVPVRVPTLAERPEDVPLLVAHFAGKLARRRGRRPPEFTPEALEELKRRPWPGNVRELQNVVERALLLAEGAVVRPEDLPGDVLRIARAGAGPEPDLLPGQTLADARDAFERRVVARVLADCRGNVSRAAERLGLDRTTLHRRLKGWGLGDDAARP